MSYVGVILNLAGVIAFYSFKRHRVFPASVLAWLGILNIIYSSYLIAKWAPGSASREAIALVPTAAMCSFGVWMDTWDVYALVSLNSLIALTLYLSVCKRISLDRESNRWYFWGYLSFFWIITIVCPLVISQNPGNSYSEGACRSVQSLTYGQIVPELIMLVFQIFAVISTIVYAKKTIAASSTVRTKTDVRMIYMIVRFSLTIVDQIMLLVSYYVVLLNVPPSELDIKVLLMCFGLAPIFDGAILLFGNRALMKLVIRKLRLVSGNNTSASSSDKSISMKARTTSPIGTVSASTLPTPSQGGVSEV
jgi:predicted neutral ceramidase superfamily lipid hydrolase